MRISPFLLAAVLASGCATSHTRIDTGPAAGGTPVTGTSYGGARVTVEYPSGSATPGLAFLAMLGLLVYADSGVTGQVLGRRGGYRVDGNGEFVGLGAANIGASLTGGFRKFTGCSIRSQETPPIKVSQGATDQ